MSHQIELAATYEEARKIGPWLAESLSTLNATQSERAGELELALHELAINIVDHAYDETNRPTSTYIIELVVIEGSLHARFRDQGQPFIDDRPASKGEPTIGGYGLMIVEQLAASVDYERAGDENRWTLVFN